MGTSAVLREACLIGSVIVLFISLILSACFARALRLANPELWNQMKPSFNSEVHEEREQRFARFMFAREYLSLNDPRIARLAAAFEISQNAFRVATYLAVAMSFWG